jgi:ferredoxin--NADP+ reductase
VSTYNVAIVGAGPAGYFSAQALQGLSNNQYIFKVDLFERLPTPWGLVRSGVAPDHPKIKSVSKVFEKISDDQNFRLFANVEVGRDISLDALKSAYDAVILAVGTPLGKRLGIPGEDLLNCWSSAEFVPWYNGHPDYSDLGIDLSGKRAIVIGAGNVAMDVARLLAMNPNDLTTTDISDHALDLLLASSITDVRICARRGAEFASFTAPELRELPELRDTNVVISAEEISDALTRSSDEVERHVKANLDAMYSIATMARSEKNKQLEFHFGYTPKEVRGTKKVESVIFSTVHGDIEIEADLVVTAIGYEADSGLNLSVDGNHFKNSDGFVEDNLYVVGWAKRGPTGVIGTNKSDAAEVAKKIVSELSLRTPKEDLDVNEVVKDLNFLNLDKWRMINQHEINLGLESGRPRVKLTKIKDIMVLIKGIS